MNSHHEERISKLLGELRENESSTGVSDDSGTQASTSACRDWYDAPHEEQSHEHPAGASYTNSRDEGTCMLRQLGRDHWMGRNHLQIERPFV